jgi:tetratricopeptide (TPR) repeat protein
MSVATAVRSTCSECSESIEPGDRFCPSCGAQAAALATTERRLVADETPAERHSALADLLASHPQRAASRSLLQSPSALCRACGADHDPGTANCPVCGSSTAPLPARIDGPLGNIYALRRGLRKRRAVRVGDEGSVAKLLLESGEVLDLESAELPDAVPSPVPGDFAPGLRTPHGSLLRLSSALRHETMKAKWDPEALAAAALDGVGDRTAARLVALDALVLNWVEVLESLSLTVSERLWLRAVHATRNSDAVAAFAAIAGLPSDRYRPKLALLARLAPAARSAGVDLATIEHQLAAYRGQEPLADLLHRAFGFSVAPGSGDEVRETTRGMSKLALCPGMPAEVAGDLATGIAALAGDATGGTTTGRLLPRNTRLLLASRDGRPGLVGPPDVDVTPLPLLDDLIENGALDRAVVLAGSRDPERTVYLRARVAPETLSDDDVIRLSHDEERARRAFRHGDADGLADLPDSPTLRHYRALVSLRGKRRDPALIDDVFPDARPVVERLLALVAAKGEGASLTDVLDDVLVADPTAWPILVEIAGSTGLAPTSELLERFPAFTEWLSLHQAREHLYLGEWPAAVGAADRCLSLARDEAVRDEALNLKACGLHHLGDDTRAVEALETAIEGAHSEALLANIGVVAAGLQPETAARYLGMLMREAPTVAMRVAAARRAVAIWSTSDTASWRNSDTSPLPDAFQDQLHELVVAPIELDDFRDFMGLLAIHDGEWLAAERNIAASPHRHSLEARFYVARARDLHEMVGVIGEAIAAGSPPQWVLDERDSLRSAALEILFENLDEPDNSFGGVALAMADNNVLANPYDDLLFTALGIASVTYHLSTREAEIGDHLVQRTFDVRRSSQQLESEDRSRLEPVIEIATRRVAINRMEARDRELSQAIDIFNSAIDLARGAEYGSPAYYEAMRRFRAVLGVATEARDDLLPLMPIVDHAGVRDDMNKTIETTRELEARCLRIMN